MTVSSDTLLVIDIDAVVVVQVEGCELTNGLESCDDATMRVGEVGGPRWELSSSKGDGYGRRCDRADGVNAESDGRCSSWLPRSSSKGVRPPATERVGSRSLSLSLALVQIDALTALSQLSSSSPSVGSRLPLCPQLPGLWRCSLRDASNFRITSQRIFRPDQCYIASSNFEFVSALAVRTAFDSTAQLVALNSFGSGRSV